VLAYFFFLGLLVLAGVLAVGTQLLMLFPVEADQVVFYLPHQAVRQHLQIN
jgi:hypothetical protein